MKKITAALLALILTFAACAAFAANIAPLPEISMEDDLTDCILHVGFNMDSISDTQIVAGVYTEQRYDAVEVTQLAVGDTVTYMGEDTVVETLETDYSTLINGGSLEGEGITLCPDEGGTFVALDGETAAYLLLGEMELTLADEITFRHWHEDALGGIAEDMLESVILAAELKDKLAEDGWDTFWPDSTTVTLEGGIVTEVNINYVP